MSATFSNTVADALAPLREMLSADGYDLDIRTADPAYLLAAITAGPDACADCLVPKDMMRTYFESALRAALPEPIPEIRLVYPADSQ